VVRGVERVRRRLDDGHLPRVLVARHVAGVDELRFVVHALRRLSLVRVSPGVGWWETTWPPIQSPYCAIAFRRPGIPARGGLAGWRGPGGSGGARRRSGGLAGFGWIRAAFGGPGGLAGLGGFGAGPGDPSGPGGVPEGL